MFHGATMVIFPKEVSYYSATNPIIERIIQKSIIGSQVVDKYFFITHPLPKENVEFGDM